MDQINVSVRVRPLQKREQKKTRLGTNSKNQWVVLGNSITHRSLGKAKKKNKTNSGLGKSDEDACPVYTFDHVFDTEIKNEDVYLGVAKDIVLSAMEGYHGTIFAYGQTSSGKTHTMIGTAKEQGVVMLAIKDIFKSLSEDKNIEDFSLNVSCMEIHNENVSDLLSDADEALRTNLKVHENESGDIFVGGLVDIPVDNVDDAIQVINKAQENRSVAATKMNDRSSRSHSIFRFKISLRRQKRDSQDENIILNTDATLNLVDLAGSERVSHTNAQGSRLQEAGNINKSLMVLGSVIGALSRKDTHIPYRNSKITRILQNSLGGNSRTAVICTLTPALLHTDNSISTLKFAASVKNVQNHARANTVERMVNLEDETGLTAKKKINELCVKMEEMNLEMDQKSSTILQMQKLHEDELKALRVQNDEMQKRLKRRSGGEYTDESRVNESILGKQDADDSGMCDNDNISILSSPVSPTSPSPSTPSKILGRSLSPRKEYGHVDASSPRVSSPSKKIASGSGATPQEVEVYERRIADLEEINRALSQQVYQYQKQEERLQGTKRNKQEDHDDAIKGLVDKIVDDHELTAEKVMQLTHWERKMLEKQLQEEKERINTLEPKIEIMTAELEEMRQHLLASENEKKTKSEQVDALNEINKELQNQLEMVSKERNDLLEIVRQQDEAKPTTNKLFEKWNQARGIIEGMNMEASTLHSVNEALTAQLESKERQIEAMEFERQLLLVLNDDEQNHLSDSQRNFEHKFIERRSRVDSVNSDKSLDSLAYTVPRDRRNSIDNDDETKDYFEDAEGDAFSKTLSVFTTNDAPPDSEDIVQENNPVESEKKDNITSEPTPSQDVVTNSNAEQKTTEDQEVTRRPRGRAFYKTDKTVKDAIENPKLAKLSSRKSSIDEKASEQYKLLLEKHEQLLKDLNLGRQRETAIIQECIDLKADVAKLQNQISDLRFEASSNINKMREENAEVRERLSNTQRSLGEKLNAWRASSSQLRTREKELQDAEMKITELKNENAELQHFLETTSQELQGKSNELDDLYNELDSAQNYMNVMRNRIDIEEEQSKEIESLREILSQYEESIDKLSDNIKRLEAKIAKQETEHSKIVVAKEKELRELYVLYERSIEHCQELAKHLSITSDAKEKENLAPSCTKKRPTKKTTFAKTIESSKSKIPTGKTGEKKRRLPPKPDNMLEILNKDYSSPSAPRRPVSKAKRPPMHF
eukprot:m.68524 g.68524  ORF g.68524 m.68524 type:complete len:1220 (-) comp11975_c0_seq3:113-3772(-)